MTDEDFITALWSELSWINPFAPLTMLYNRGYIIPGEYTSIIRGMQIDEERDTIANFLYMILCAEGVA